MTASRLARWSSVAVGSRRNSRMSAGAPGSRRPSPATPSRSPASRVASFQTCSTPMPASANSRISSCRLRPGQHEGLRDVGAEIEFCAGVEQHLGQLLLLRDRGHDLPLDVVGGDAVVEPAVRGMPDHVEIERRDVFHVVAAPRGVEVAIAEHAVIGDDGRRVGDAVLQRRFDDLVHAALVDLVPVAGAVDERVALQRLGSGYAEEVLHLGDAGIFVGEPRRHVAHDLQAVSCAGLLQRADHRLGETFVEFHEACAGAFTFSAAASAACRARVRQQDRVPETRLAGADKRTAPEQPRHRMNAAVAQSARGIDRRCRRDRRRRAAMSRHGRDRRAPRPASASARCRAADGRACRSGRAGRSSRRNRAVASDEPSEISAIAPSATASVAAARRPCIGLTTVTPPMRKRPCAEARGGAGRRRPRLVNMPMARRSRSFQDEYEDIFILTTI